QLHIHRGQDVLIHYDIDTGDADVFNGRARAAQVALVDNAYSAAYAPGGNIFSVFDFVIENGRITGINVVVDKDILATMDVQLV
ncbi:MAG TPA: hypothetical protein VK519_16425, partial [Pinirhizobacter sp.]|uniref:hypothetical protein n=1 Tax=Pinirhizobacter sp. TaxID=2950432 RepID=UPI002C61639E